MKQQQNVIELEKAYGWNAQQLEVIKTTVAKNVTLPELHHFLTVAKISGLNPFLRQIYFVKRKGVGTIQVGIDGYRSLADRTGCYAGNDDPIFEYKDDKPISAAVTVYKMVDHQRCAFTATARWSHYYPGEKMAFMWDKMPELMLGKCAEALALRKAFPAQLSGLYTHEEMEQANGLDPAKEVTSNGTTELNDAVESQELHDEVEF